MSERLLNRPWPWAALLFLCSLAAGAALPPHVPVPGGLAVLDLGPAENPPPVAHYQGRRLAVVGDQGHWYALVGIPLTARPGEHQIELGDSRHLAFEVRPKAYETQHITIKDKRKVNPYKKDLERIARERKRIQAALRHFRETTALPLAFRWPVEGEISSPFGLRRYFNNEPRKPHSGLDIAAPEGTPIRAPAAGMVLDKGDFFFNGNTVFIDHGQGLVTMYCHMSRIDVQPGEHVEAGQVIGAVGRTGRVTGPHLHWGVSLNDARIDPRLLLQSKEANSRQDAK